MKPKLWLALLVALVLSIAALDSRAQMIVLDDPAEVSSENLILPSAARTTTTTSGTVSAQGRRCLFYILAVSSCGTCSVTPSLQAYDRGTDAWFNYQTAAAAVVAPGNYRYLVCAETAAITGAITQLTAAPPPPIFRVSVVANNANSGTYTVSGVAW